MLDGLSPRMEHTWQRERISSYQLSSGLHPHQHMPNTHPCIHINKRNLKILRGARKMVS